MRLRNTLLGFTAALALSAGAASAADFVFPIGEGAQFNWKSLEDFKAAHGDLAGQTLTIFGPWRGEDDTLFRSVLAYFTEATGINVKYSSSENYEQQVVIDTQAGSPAERFGVRAGDVVVAVDGNGVRTIEQFVKAFESKVAGDAVKLTIERDGWRSDVRVTLSARQ